ncbi:MAG: hypothetical protein LBS40_08330 [Burkholderiales bacterium]|jgi:hypothetical protein|nr:hypothetical protein [Burkholderiales bacterium]
MKNAKISSYRKKQQGIVLAITLLVLVAMMLAAVGMMRSVDTSVIAVGNLSLKQAAEGPVNLAIEEVIQQALGLAATPEALDNNGGLGGDYYYASIQPTNDKGIPDVMANGTGNFLQRTINGMTLNTMVERMCRGTGAGSPAICLTNLIGTPDDRHKAGEELAILGGGATNYLYRITIRVDGAKNTRAYAQAYVFL